MTSNKKPMKVSLKGNSVENPDKVLVKVSDELSDAQLENVSGGVLYFPITVETVKLPVGVGSFHLGAWAT